MQNKRCPKCRKEKSLSYFYKSKSIKDGFRCWCKSCSREANKRYYPKRDVKQHKLNNRKSVLKIRFGITLEQYDQLFEKQNGACAICGQPETRKHGLYDVIMRLAVDHNHKTGKVRGLLCRRCNTVLGQAEENIKILKNMIVYLKKK